MNTNGIYAGRKKQKYNKVLKDYWKQCCVKYLTDLFLWKKIIINIWVYLQ
jgi:hypothetical protein